MTDFFQVAALITALLPYMVYTWVYKSPSSFSRFFTQKQFIEFAQWTKILSIFCAAPTMFRSGVNAHGLCIGLPFAVIGQYLSEVVYSALGDAGVYYGIELAVVKPRRITGFPFEISDPQYRGSLLTVIGFLLFFNTTRESGRIITAWILAYFYQICMENTKPGMMVRGEVGDQIKVR
jgi:hypothetical protein